MGAAIPFIPAAVSIGSSLLGANAAKQQRKAGARSAQSASDPLSVVGPLGESAFNPSTRTLEQQLSPELQSLLSGSFGGAQDQLNLFRGLDIRGLENQELSRLRELSAPREAQALAQLRGQIFNQGRQGFGIGGGRTGGFSNPELQALLEAQAGADLGRIGTAQGFARAEQSRLLDNFVQLLTQGQGIGSSLNNQSLLGIQGRTPAGVAGLAAEGGREKAKFLDTLFGSLAGPLGNAAGGLLGGSGTPFIGGAGPVVNPTGGGNPFGGPNPFGFFGQ